MSDSEGYRSLLSDKSSRPVHSLPKLKYYTSWLARLSYFLVALVALYKVYTCLSRGDGRPHEAFRTRLIRSLASPPLCLLFLSPSPCSSSIPVSLFSSFALPLPLDLISKILGLLHLILPILFDGANCSLCNESKSQLYKLTLYRLG